MCTSVLVLDISRARTHQEEKGKQPLDGTGLAQEVLHLATQHRKKFLTLPENHKLQPQSKQQTISAGAD